MKYQEAKNATFAREYAGFRVGDSIMTDEGFLGVVWAVNGQQLSCRNSRGGIFYTWTWKCVRAT